MRWMRVVLATFVCAFAFPLVTLGIAAEWIVIVFSIVVLARECSVWPALDRGVDRLEDTTGRIWRWGHAIGDRA